MAKTSKKRRGVSPLTIRERSVIEVRWCMDGKTITEIAEELTRNKSSISREIGGKHRKGCGKYHADVAHRQALARIARRGNTTKTEKCPALRAYIEDKLINEQWSPEQISIRLPHEYAADETMRIAAESIYREVYRRVYRGGNGAVKQGELDLRPYLARRHTRRAKKGFRKAQRLEREESLPSIEVRPKAVDRRGRIGDWEDDTLVSRATTVRIKSVNERTSGVVFFGKTADGTAVSCDRVLTKRLSVIPPEYRRTLTRDRGSENLRWEEVQEALSLDVYFAHPYASYERGSNENTNGLLRRYFPKKTNWSEVSNAEIAQAERSINTRPRKRLGGLTPVEVFFRATGVAIYS